MITDGLRIEFFDDFDGFRFKMTFEGAHPVSFTAFDEHPANLVGLTGIRTGGKADKWIAFSQYAP